MEENVRKPVKRIEVFLSRIAGNYPPLTFSVDGHDVPFRRGRLRLEGDDIHASEVTVMVPPDAEFVPVRPVVPIVDGRIFVELMPRAAAAEVVAVADGDPATPEDEIPYDGEVPAAEYFDDDDLQPVGRASRATLWILGLACLVCIAIIFWFIFIPRNAATPPVADSDSVKTDTAVVVDSTTAQDSVKEAEEIVNQVVSAINYGSYDYNYDSESVPEEEPAVKRREVPEGTDFATEQEH